MLVIKKILWKILFYAVIVFVWWPVCIILAAAAITHGLLVRFGKRSLVREFYIERSAKFASWAAGQGWRAQKYPPLDGEPLGITVYYPG